MVFRARELPDKYYLAHFNEFIAHINAHCQSLLGAPQRDFLTTIQQLDHNSLCMLVRIINRSGEVVQAQAMEYAEIERCQEQITKLVAAGLLRALTTQDFLLWLPALSKAQLTELLHINQAPSFPASVTKQQLLSLAAEHCQAQRCVTSTVGKSFLYKAFTEQWAYLLFIYFGNLTSALNKFSMRDLGVLKTRDSVAVSAPRFSSLGEAQSAFEFAKLRQTIKYTKPDTQQLLTLAQAMPAIPVGDTAQRYADEYYYLLGKALLNIDVDLAIQTLGRSHLATAQEKYLRERYKAGHKEQVKQQLEKILESSGDSALCLFAEDFYQRKFNQVKVSQLTQMLRDSAHIVALDEVYRDSPERGVKAHYERQGMQVYRTENTLFSALFALLFWQELFVEDELAVASEFDRRPRSVRENTVYQSLATSLDRKLAKLVDAQTTIKLLSQNVLKYYAQPNGMFRWHRNLLVKLTAFLQAAPMPAVIEHLRAMAKDYHSLNDGYPDLLLIDQHGLRFVEVKSPGDSLRSNQLVTIKALQQAGFDVDICKVEWLYDATQPYVVVDVETTGGKAAGHRITEIAAVKIVNGAEVDRWTTLLNPQRRIPKFITQLTGISDAMVADAPLFCEIVDSLDAFLQGSIFVAHNVNFDYGFFKLEYERLERRFSLPKLCTVREMRKYFPGLGSYALKALCTEFGIPLQSHHRAMCDAEAAAELLKMVIEQKQSTVETQLSTQIAI
ncbi:MAG: 3'-5' exonuclease [Paraglaciecola sp.]|nr:3'-5' exonuclease [Paraglaciecola sp.]NCT49211.1 3'-5' exonuclease [Paraglaciecola sp.]